MNLVEKIAKHLWEARQPITFPKWEDNRNGFLKAEFKAEASSIIQAVLSDPSICEIDLEAELPSKPDNWRKETMDFHVGYYACEKAMAGWVKPK